MPELNQLTKAQLINPEVLEKIKKAVLDIAQAGLIAEAVKLQSQLEKSLEKFPELKNQNPPLYQQYQKLILALKWTAMPFYDNETLMDLLKNHFLEALEMKIDLDDRMTMKMYSLPDLVWPETAQELLAALKENNQRIGQQTIAEWLKDYDKAYGLEKHSVLEQSEYLTQNPNVKTLTEEERDKLKQLIRFYDNLKPLSLSKIEQAIKQFAPQLLEEKITPAEKPEAPLPEKLREPPVSPPIPPVPSEEIERATPSAPRPAVERDIYREPLPPARPSEPSQVEPRIEGNVVDLKGEK